MITHLELFAGIGGFRHAIDLFGKDTQTPIQCVGFSEIDDYATKTYKSNYNTTGEVEIGDIVHYTSDVTNIESLPDFTILTGGFPCQSFSMMGKMNGFNDIRGNVFFRIIDLLNVKKPPFILLENVRNLRTHDKGNTFQTITKAINEAGYPYIYHDIFNTEDFGLAQTRNRVYIFASRFKLDEHFKFDTKTVKAHFTKIEKTSLLKQSTVLDVLSKQVEAKYYLSETLKPTILADGAKNFKSKSEINQLIARPLTATMVKMHRACQDNYFSDEFVHNIDPINYLKTTKFTKEELAKQHIRKLTPVEAFALQGFESSFTARAIDAGISNHQLYKQAGNAASVNTVYAILHYLFTQQNIMHYVL